MPLQQFDSLISDFTERSQSILGDSLAGIYLHGSAVMGCFNPLKSDLDLIVVVSRPLTDPVKKEYMDMVVHCSAQGPAKGIEMSVVLREACRAFVYPTPFELHFSAGHLKWYRDDPEDYIRKMKGKDKDLAAHFTIIRKRGKCLYGAPIEDVFAEVPPGDYMDSIWNDIAEAPETIADDTMYLTLNLARVLAWQEEGLVLSKKEGGEWALSHLPAEYRPLVADALDEYSGSGQPAYDGALARRYAVYAVGRIRKQQPER